jgi:hypothetical protein
VTTDEYADDLGTIPVLRRPIHIVTHEDEFALTPREMTTYHRADGEMIADFGWVTDLEWFEDDAWPTELVEESLSRGIARRSRRHPCDPAQPSTRKP